MLENIHERALVDCVQKVLEHQQKSPRISSIASSRISRKNPRISTKEPYNIQKSELQNIPKEP